MWKQFSLQATYEWIPIVKSLIQSYNDTKHRTIRMKAKDVTAAHEKYLLRHVYGKLKTPRTKEIKFKVGDKLIEYEDQPIEGGFYQEELTKVTYPDVDLVEKILRRRGNKVFVKWLSFDNSHNSWIDKDAL
ncbi:uncharacterized protein LOC107041752 [Diachasma alloeum]|uniref:uncharacterized protein LOC107041752 n=1 Tax=Diachasma alloeum TaxID=454923 RepID=UPI0007381688|nr:uncharacterized protein LOC107041752 [Diachasma alloeum]